MAGSRVYTVPMEGNGNKIQGKITTNVFSYTVFHFSDASNIYHGNSNCSFFPKKFRQKPLSKIKGCFFYQQTVPI